MSDSLLLKNIGTIISGDIDAPVLEGDAILVTDGKIEKIGALADFGAVNADKTIDCKGTTVTPGLIDSHCHVILGDYTSPPKAGRVYRKRGPRRRDHYYFRRRSPS